MRPERLRELAEGGWQITRDGSTSTARFAQEDAEDAESGWEVLVLYTSGHRGRLTLHVYGFGLTEQTLSEAGAFLNALAQARELLESWTGEPPEEG